MTALIFVPYQWRSQWRELRQKGAWRGANVSMVIFLGVLGLAAQLGLAALAVAALTRGDAEIGAALVEMGLTGVLMGWIVLPLLVSSVAGGGAGVTVRRLVQFPLSPLQLFTVGAVGSLLQPVYWVLMLASLVALAPLVLMPLPVPGLVAGVLYVAAAAVVSWAVGLVASAVMSSRRGREVALTVVAAVAFGLFPLYMGDLDHEDGRITFTLRGHEVLLVDFEARTGLLASSSAWAPAALVGGAARGEAVALRLAILAAALAGGTALSVASLRRLLRQPAEGMGGARSRARAITGLPGLPPWLGATTVKELRYLLRTLDALLGFVFGAIAAGWIALRPGDAPHVLILCQPIIVLNQMVIPLNVFGLDGPAADRYRLLPLTGVQVLLSKNLAFVLLVLMEIAAPVLVGFWRIGPAFTLAALCAGLSASLLMTVWGNQTSVRSPARREFFNFDSKEQAGGILSMLGVCLLWLVPFLVGVVAKASGGGHLLLLALQILLLLASVSLYRFNLPGAGRAFDERAEAMRAGLAGAG